jgi:hypothetical protein
MKYYDGRGSTDRRMGRTAHVVKKRFEMQKYPIKIFAKEQQLPAPW